ncbi:intradiol ring-cleavage dioxygenase [Chitinophaga sp. sic0106]|uniref:dioxygenase family protein n=1 Tax=Chitinophaga sp. sic0106 TaxID=2854785 RepID=UPI001C4382C8|nr:intradiol ring-cleavage dioxygenase [Chitinophaga sp. sic0106]MBV7529312.1 intradiol ring-cleavage dioxygenase [Chitinophaga sp. sic0106]
MEQSRKKFLKNLLVSAAAMPIVISACKKSSASTDDDSNSNNSACAKSPEETDGPYPLYASRNSTITHVDITEGKTGIPLYVTINVLNVNNNCLPLANARVDVWHCDKDGYYSGYTNNGYLGTQNNEAATFCRGIQTTDANGQVKFATIYPGWYTGRITHIHAQVYVSDTLKVTTQIAFPDDINALVYKTDLYAAHGQNTAVARNSADMVFADSLYAELAAVTVNATGGYDLVHTIRISG